MIPAITIIVLFTAVFVGLIVIGRRSPLKRDKKVAVSQAVSWISLIQKSRLTDSRKRAIGDLRRDIQLSFWLGTHW
jgi:hypothetical protein